MEPASGLSLIHRLIVRRLMLIVLLLLLVMVLLLLLLLLLVLIEKLLLMLIDVRRIVIIITIRGVAGDIGVIRSINQIILTTSETGASCTAAQTIIGE